MHTFKVGQFPHRKSSVCLRAKFAHFSGANIFQKGQDGRMVGVRVNSLSLIEDKHLAKRPGTVTESRTNLWHVLFHKITHTRRIRNVTGEKGTCRSPSLHLCLFIKYLKISTRRVNSRISPTTNISCAVTFPGAEAVFPGQEVQLA